MSSRHPFADGHAPEWAVAWGVDEHGAYADFAVGQVVQRMRWIPPGGFWMGSSEWEQRRWGDDEPMRWVRLWEGIWLGDTPVTQALWVAVMGSNPSEFAAEPDSGGLERPVEQVSWEEAQGFCEVLAGIVPGQDEVRLPTEAEWERACRADATTDLSPNTYGEIRPPWSGPGRGAELRAVAWFRGEGGRGTKPVKGKEPNPLGLYDMLGNVWEWCADASVAYDGNDVVDPLAVGSSASSRVNRGGSWSSPSRRCRAAYRPGRFSRNSNWDRVGFRLARGSKPGGGAAFQQARAAGTDPRQNPNGGRAEPPDPGTVGGGAGREDDSLTLAVVAVVDRRGGATARVFDALRKRLRERGRGIQAASEVAASVAQRWDIHRVVIWAERFDALDDEWRWPASGKGRTVGEWIEGARAGVPLHVVAVTSEAARWVEELSGVVMHRSLREAEEALSEGEIPDIASILRGTYRREPVGTRAWNAAWCARWRRFDDRGALEARALPMLQDKSLRDGFWSMWWLVEAQHTHDDLSHGLHRWALSRVFSTLKPSVSEFERYWHRARLRLSDPVGDIVTDAGLLALQQFPVSSDVWWQVFEGLEQLSRTEPIREGLRGQLRPRAVEWLLSSPTRDDRATLAKAVAGY